MLIVLMLSLGLMACNEQDETVAPPIEVDGVLNGIDFGIIHSGIAKMDKLDPRDLANADPSVAANNPNLTHQRYRLTLSNASLLEVESSGLRYFTMDRDTEDELIIEIRLDLYAPIVNEVEGIGFNLMGGEESEERVFEWRYTQPPVTVTDDYFMSEALVTIIDKADDSRNRAYRVTDEGMIKLRGSGLRFIQDIYLRGTDAARERYVIFSASRVSDLEPLNE